MDDNPTLGQTVAQLEGFASFALGQLQALHADHRIRLEFPGVGRTLPAEDVRRGRHEGERWIAELQTRAAQLDLPEHVRRRGEAARTAHRLGETA
jgi:hypothetical protein